MKMNRATSDTDLLMVSFGPNQTFLAPQKSVISQAKSNTNTFKGWNYYQTNMVSEYEVS